ncbi:MAG: hypothetical protein JW884_06145 [Deltaproteobacteria bacterium]|nr:hypothetical protein [Deltaproteobacteria bacterium]
MSYNEKSRCQDWQRLFKFNLLKGYTIARPSPLWEIIIMLMIITMAILYAAFMYLT